MGGLGTPGWASTLLYILDSERSKEVNPGESDQISGDVPAKF
uniref:Uncharacterized protein n=1 Tax=Rhizophora mucronata TaxID=61149 RepID=A0A2P2KA84_RHIMU